MEDGRACGGDLVAAPFVLKTYRMVNDPSTDPIISWGRENNSFVVADPFAFSQTLLPSHFKHNNFSSFVRQLNTYGFRKVDPDRWEFAHASFLRGQTHLLRQIVRRSGGGKRREGEVGEGEGEVAMEVVRLKNEQRAIEDRIERMWRRVQETERRPRQMLAFLVRVVGDPQLLRRLTERGAAAAEEEGGEKRARLRLEGDHGTEEMEGEPLDSPQTGEGEIFGGDDVDPFISAVDPVDAYGGFGGVEMDGSGGRGGYGYLYDSYPV